MRLNRRRRTGSANTLKAAANSSAAASDSGDATTGAQHTSICFTSTTGILTDIDA
jgi:hypothetical protein